MSVIMVAKSVIAQSIETMRGLVVPKGANSQIKIGGLPKSIAINTKTNKIYVLNPANGTVTVIDSNSGEVKNIHVGKPLGNPLFPDQYDCPYCITVDDIANKIYVANRYDYSNTVSVINGTDDTVKSVPVGWDPSFILVDGNRVYVANSRSNTVSVIDGNSDTVKRTISGFSTDVPLRPFFVLTRFSSFIPRLTLHFTQYPSVVNLS